MSFASGGPLQVRVPPTCFATPFLCHDSEAEHPQGLSAPFPSLLKTHSAALVASEEYRDALRPMFVFSVQEICGFGGVSPVKVAGTGTPIIQGQTERPGAI